MLNIFLFQQYYSHLVNFNYEKTLPAIRCEFEITNVRSSGQYSWIWHNLGKKKNRKTSTNMLNWRILSLLLFCVTQTRIRWLYSSRNAEKSFRNHRWKVGNKTSLPTIRRTIQTTPRGEKIRTNGKQLFVPLCPPNLQQRI